MGEQKPHGKTPLRGSPSPETTYLPTSSCSPLGVSHPIWTPVLFPSCSSPHQTSVLTRSRGGPATGRCGGHTQVSRQAKHYAHKGINALSCDKAFQNPCHSAKRERKYVQQHIRIYTHGVKTGLGIKGQ